MSVCRRCVLRVSNGFPARSGATRSAKPPKTERGGSVPNEFAPNLPRSVFRLRRASPPPLGHCPCGARRGACPALAEDRFELWLGQHRAQPTAFSAVTAPRAAYASLRLFSRRLGLNEDAAGTLCTGRENRSPVHLGRVGTFQARGWTTGAARSVLLARRVDRVIRVFSVDRVGKHR